MRLIIFMLGTLILGMVSFIGCNDSKLTGTTVDAAANQSMEGTTNSTPTPTISKATSDSNSASATTTGSNTTSSSTTPSSTTSPVCTPSSTSSQVTTSSTTATRTRPRVFMALHGSNNLANNAALDSQWTYVRANLDGLWGNNANISGKEEAALWNKLTTRTLITEWDSVAKSSFVSPALFGGASDNDPSIVINREAISLYTSTASDWNGTTIADATANYVTNSGVSKDRLFKAVYTGWQPQNFQGAGLTGDALTAFNAAGGTFLECGRDVCINDPLKTAFETAIKMAHAKNQVFIWFNGTDNTSDWMAKSQSEYNHLIASNLLLPTDVVMIINYGGAMTPTPEVDAQGNAANTVTGMLYWLLHQGAAASTPTPTPTTAATAACTFLKHGNNGTVSCDTFCAGSQWPGGVGTCSSGTLSATNQAISCGTTPGFTTAEVICTCVSH